MAEIRPVPFKIYPHSATRCQCLQQRISMHALQKRWKPGSQFTVGEGRQTDFSGCEILS